MTEDIGRHKGAVETLLHEKKELSRLLQIVNSQLEKHMGALEEAGVDTEQFIQEVRQQGHQQQQGNQQRSQQDQGGRRQSRDQQQGSQGRQSRSQRQSGNSGNQGSEDEEDADDLLEGEDDFSDRDFSPR